MYIHIVWGLLIRTYVPGKEISNNNVHMYLPGTYIFGREILID